MKKVFLYLLVFVYAIAGIYHFVNPAFYEMIIPEWLPSHSLLNYIGGVSEMVFAVLLLSDKTRKLSAYLIVAMLVVFLVLIHIPMAIDFYKNNHPGLWIAIVRLPIQLMLIWWAFIYTKPL